MRSFVSEACIASPMGQIWNFGVQAIARFRSLILHAKCNGFRGEASRHGKKPLNQRYPGTCRESQCQQEQKLSVAIGLQSGAVRSLPTPTCCGIAASLFVTRRAI